MKTKIVMNSDLTKLHPYPFEKLSTLLSGVFPPKKLSHISLSIGEPKHPSPSFVAKKITSSMDKLSMYPSTKGTLEFRESVSAWLKSRFSLKHMDPESQVLPVNGTREALFAFSQATIDRTNNPLILMPNPFYQIYEGAALLSGAKIHFLSCNKENDFLTDFSSVSDKTWDSCQLIYICSPGNPSGAVLDISTLQKLIKLADKHNFIIASDECYSEIYYNENKPPVGLLEACAVMQRHDYQRCIVFHSLSKRSNLPGLRAGFVAGDAGILESFLQYRTYQGCAMPLITQLASIAAWGDEVHVKENRKKYRQKFEIFQQILGDILPLNIPDGGFYLWVNILSANIGDDETFSKELFSQQNVTVLPGSYLGRISDNSNPGRGYIRMALVAPVEECRQAAERIKKFITSYDSS
ncbi:MAG: N-succinyldiaminopimelate aminotransferase [Saprospiraceae bacterium]|jgi:N-succinyldiaminopimelate aminotransferase|tara:strand:- start:602 stop:1831 length:1230 start_codon:yes stop_codon:yes gene_type:complete